MGGIIIPYKPRDLQKDFHDNIKRWNLIVTHRRFGKTCMVINQLIKDCLLCKKERPRFAYISPYLVQTKQIAWDYVKHYTAVIPGVKFNESELKVTFVNGGNIQLLGADNPDRLRGIYLDGVALDEYAQIKPSLFSEIISPALTDRQGYAIFLGTPKGKNHFYDLWDKIKDNPEWYVAIRKASDTGYVAHDELVRASELMSADEFAQEYDCSWEAAIKGAFYADEYAKAKKEQRICKVPYDPNLLVHTAWDIGYKDDTAIIFYQIFGKEIRIIDAYSNSGMTLAEYAGVLRGRGYEYGQHFFPWDAKIKPMSSGKSTIDVAKEYGITADLTPDLSVLEGINQVRLLFPNCWFDEVKCKDLLNALSQYHRDYDQDKKTFRASPLHDWTSHFADSMRYLAISVPRPKDTYDYTREAETFLYAEAGKRTRDLPGAPIDQYNEERKAHEFINSSI